MNVEYADEESGMNPGELGLHTAIVSHTQVSNYQWRTQAWTTIIKKPGKFSVFKGQQSLINLANSYIAIWQPEKRINFFF